MYFFESDVNHSNDGFRPCNFEKTFFRKVVFIRLKKVEMEQQMDRYILVDDDVNE